MLMEGKFTIKAPIQKLWDTLLDPETLLSCIPGAEKIERIDGLTLAESPPYSRNNHWMYPLRIDREVYGKDREELMEYLKGEGIQTRPVWHLNHLQAPYSECQSYRIEEAIHLHDVTLSIPCSTNLKMSEIEYVTERLRHG